MSAASINPGVTPISEIDENYIGLKTKISGEVIKTRKHSDGHLFLQIRGKDYNKIRIPIFAQTNSNLNEKIELLDNIEIKGEVNEYRGDLQVTPQNSESIKVVKSAPINISKISKAQAGEIVRVRGYISEKNKNKDGSYSIIIKNDGNKIKAHIPKEIASSSKFEMMRESTLIQVGGPLELRKGEIAIKIRNPHNIRFETSK